MKDLLNPRVEYSLKEITEKDIPKWGDDLGSYCERFICEEIYHKPVFIFNYPKDLKSLWSVDNKTTKTLKFNFGEKGFSSIAVDTSGRSGTYQRVHVTEFADLCKKYPKKVVDIIEVIDNKIRSITAYRGF